MAKSSKRKPGPAASGDEAKAGSAELVHSGWVMVLLRAAAIIGAGLWVYSPVFHGDWLWDDDWYIGGNPLVRDVSGLWQFWFHPGMWIEYYPIEETLLWMEWHLFGQDTLGYHLITINLHIIDALLLWRLLDKLGLPKAWLGGLIFAVHPVCVESVAWIVETKNTLSLLPLLLAMAAWVDYEDRKCPRDYAWALGLFLMAMLCKISVSSFPLVILLYAWWKRHRIDWGDIKASTPFFVVSIGLVKLTMASGTWYYLNLHQVPDINAPEPFSVKVVLAGQSLALFFAHCFWPVNLLPVYPQWKPDPAAPLQYLPWLVLAGVLSFLWRKRDGWGRHALLGIGFYLVFIAPFLGFATASYMTFTWIMDHFLYIPIIGLIGLVVAALGSIEEQIPLARRSLLTGSITILITLLAFEAKAYAVAYSDEVTLWNYTVEHDPGSWKAQDNLAKALLLLDRSADAAPHFEAAIQLHPGHYDMHLNLGRALAQMGQLDDGLKQYDEALRLQPDSALIYNQKGVSLFQAGRAAEALAQFKTATELRPNFALALENYASALTQNGNLPEALDKFAQVLKITPDDITTLDNYGSTLMLSGRADEALATFQHVLRLDPTDAKARQAMEQLQAGTPAKP